MSLARSILTHDFDLSYHQSEPSVACNDFRASIPLKEVAANHVEYGLQFQQGWAAAFGQCHILMPDNLLFKEADLYTMRGVSFNQVDTSAAGRIVQREKSTAVPSIKKKIYHRATRQRVHLSRKAALTHRILLLSSLAATCAPCAGGVDSAHKYLRGSEGG